MKDAGIETGDVIYVNAHGTSTPLNDRSETNAIKTAFGQTTAHVPLHAWSEAARHARDELGCTQFDWLGVEDAGRPGAIGQRHAVLLHVLDPDTKDGVLLRQIGGWPTARSSSIWRGWRHCRRRWSAPPACFWARPGRR